MGRSAISKKIMQQHWQKLSFYFNPEQFGLNYAAVPIIVHEYENLVRIIFTSRNNCNQSVPYWIDMDTQTFQFIGEPQKVIIPLGDLGTFDDSGIMPSSFITVGNEIWMYYIGWNLGVTVPFRNSIGLAISNDLGKTFHKKYLGPIIDRTKDEPYFTASNCVIFDKGVYKIWYLSCVKWEFENGKPIHYYHIKYATSVDGITWERKGQIAIDFKNKLENAISVPRVIIEYGIYKMWYSYRNINNTYKIGYAESSDGINWKRLDDIVNFNTTPYSFDSEMICYPFIFDYKDNRYMLYNGNGYGKTGFGIAVLEK